DNTLGRFAGSEENQGWNAEHGELGGNQWVGIHIQLGDSDSALVLDGQLVNHRLEHLAGRAPGGPEIDEHRLLRRRDRGFEILIGYLEKVLRHAAPSFVVAFWSVLAGPLVSLLVSVFVSAFVSVLGLSVDAAAPSLPAPRESVL